MGKKNILKMGMIFSGLILVGVLAARDLTGRLSSGSQLDAVILDVAGNAEYYDPEENGFVAAEPGQPVAAGQSLITGEKSSVRIGFFEDGSGMHVDQFSSLTFLESGEMNGVKYARLRLEIGSIFVVPQEGMLYVDTPFGTAFSDVPGAALQVTYDPQIGQSVFTCLEGVCKYYAEGKTKMLSSGQQVVLNGEGLAGIEEFDEDILDKVVAESYKPADGEAVQTAAETLKSYFNNGPKIIPQGPAVSGIGQPMDEDSLPSGQEKNTESPEVPPDDGPQPVPTEEAPFPTPENEPSPVPATASAEASDLTELRSSELIHNGDYSSNPGIGWQYRGGDYPVSYPFETVAYGPRSDISWKNLNPAEGVYDWKILDSQLNYVISQGKQFSFRVYTMRGEDFGGHQVPQWVIAKGAKILPSGEVDYSNCVYQQEWGTFVEKLVQRYDGNPNIAFIDISGYGNFNEWSWQDQTVWDQTWADAYAAGKANRSTMVEMDSFARRVLADMFIGGSYSSHQCRTADNQVETVSYSYSGFRQTQLLMPYAGIRQSSQYVYAMSNSVGFRHDCLGRTSSNSIFDDDKLGKELANVWPKAPIVFETCSPSNFSFSNAEYLLKRSHASLVHDVNIDMSTSEILRLVPLVGYRYELKNFRYNFRIEQGSHFLVSMEWQNTGYAPAYPRMGQRFELHVYYYDAKGNQVADIRVDEDISKWMPAENFGGTSPTYLVEIKVPVGDNVATGIYTAEAKIIDTRTGKPIWLPIKQKMMEAR